MSCNYLCISVSLCIYASFISIISCSNLRAGLYVCMPKCTYVMYLCIYVQILETQSDVWQKKDMRPLLKTQNYPRIITSKYTQKMYIKPTKEPNICNSAPFFCFLVVSMAFHTLFFSHPKKNSGSRGNTTSAVGTWYVTFSSVSSSHPSRSQPVGSTIFG